MFIISRAKFFLAPNPASIRVSERIRSLCVFGAGQMGTGIALVAARHLPLTRVHVFDSFRSSLDRSEAFVRSWADKEVRKGRLREEETAGFLSRLSFHDLANNDCDEIFSEIDFAIEAVPEIFDLKEKIILNFEKNSKFDAIFATNTSSISITKIASVSSRPENVIGMHFMNPVPVMPLVEIIKGLSTSDETLKLTQELCRAISKTPATAIDRPGFVANRLLMPYINEAIFTLQEGIASRDDIDKIMKLGTNAPMGPLELADFIGLDTCLAIMQVLHNEFADSKYRPAPLLVQMVTAKKLGRKTHEGFYLY